MAKQQKRPVGRTADYIIIDDPITIPRDAPTEAQDATIAAWYRLQLYGRVSLFVPKVKNNGIA
jgi:hypothetical protein